MALLAGAGLVLLWGCGSTRQIRVENVSTRHFTKLSIAGRAYGDVAPGETTDYQTVELRFRYASLELYVDGKYVTAQSLDFGSSRFTYRIDVRDFEAGHLAIDVVRDGSSAGSD